jgi:hypothetical protein
MRIVRDPGAGMQHVLEGAIDENEEEEQLHVPDALPRASGSCPDR